MHLVDQSIDSACGPQLRDDLAPSCARTIMIPSMILYTCPAQTHGATTPVIKHPCGVAAKALDEARQPYEVRVVGGFKNVPFSRRG
ncbi:MAG: hypothetical protein Q7R41_06250, partial [Phycisphaerales bacterium]|nr:hypothetical protein [Phycisphaerales bacterium]